VQLIAIDSTDKRIIAPEAKKQINYSCPQCSERLRLRKGAYVQAHFYHYHATSKCPHRKKTLAHLRNQLYIAQELPQGEAILEHPFPSIGRIADVFWPQKGLVFEVQCSPMSLEEAEKRERDYRHLGFELVWILHERRYNRRRLSAAEFFFIKRNTYFSSICEAGAGKIYDQFSIIKGGIRCYKGAQFPIAPSHPFPVIEKHPSQYPKTLLQHWESRTLGFNGDMLDRALQNPNYDYATIRALEERFLVRKRVALFDSFIQIYRAFLYALLEKIG